MYTRKRRLPVQWGWIQAAGAFAGLPVQNIMEASIMERVYRQGRKRGGLSRWGASGSGKTTLLNCLSTIDSVSAGHIMLDGKDITKLREEELAAFRRDNLGFVFQEYNRLDTLTLEENMALPLTIQGLGPEEIGLRVRKIADKLQIGDVLGKFPFQRAV